MSKLTLSLLRRFDLGHAKVRISPAARRAMRRSRAAVDRRIRDGIRTYGVNTGLGSLSDRAIAPDHLEELQRRLVLSNAAGTGPLMADADVRRMMLLKVGALATGWSGARPALAEALVALLNAGITPCVPSKGSVGASGDLAPLAHMAAALIGVGEVRVGGRTMPAKEALRKAGLEPFQLAAKEGLSLVNGTQASTSLAIAGLFAAEAVFAAAMVSGMLSLEAMLGQDLALDERLHLARGQEGQIAAAAAYRALLKGSALRRRARVSGRLQDPYCLRCQPQVMGAVLDQLRHAALVLERECASATDNPLVDPATGDILYGGNFHAEPIGLAADGIALAIAETGAMAERRIAMLTDAHHSGLPAFLASDSGIDSGFMVAQVTAAALASENKALAHPASVDSIPTTANHEDFVSMATFAARRLSEMADNAAGIVAIELLAACQGLEFRRPARSSRTLEAAHAALRDKVPAYSEDRFLAPDIAAVKAMVQDGHFLHVIPAGIRLS
ncbi:MAG: histidine ammonia-lyase [Parvibaculaceae bacterium]